MTTTNLRWPEATKDPMAPYFGLYNMDEADVLDVEAGLVSQIEKYRHDLMRCNFRDEDAITWGDEDAQFLALRIHRASAMLFELRQARRNES